MATMIARLQRILSAVELFALVLWVGGGFALTVFAYPVLQRLLAGDGEAGWAAIEAISLGFQRAALIFGSVVLASNFLKGAILGRFIPLQRYALLAATISLLFAGADVFLVRERLREKAEQVASLGDQPTDRLQVQIQELRRQMKVIEAVNVALGLFLVYAWRHFEERKSVGYARLLAAHDNSRG
jgi:uncharacterized membrane protein